MVYCTRKDCIYRNEQTTYGLCTIGNLHIDQNYKCADYKCKEILVDSDTGEIK